MSTNVSPAEASEGWFWYSVLSTAMRDLGGEGWGSDDEKVVAGFLGAV